ncbi:hypothetical protein [Hyphomicrobium nitrativorans]|nr:hypothetical protein [Hyphomicrobium nitrativorans]
MVKTTTTSVLRAAAVFGAIASGTMPLAANEVLPWANTPPTVATAEPAAADPAVEAAIAQCTPLFEAACRDLNTCAWIADVSLQDGTVLPARCVARPSAPPKSTAKAKTPAPKKKTAETPKAPAAKPAAATETGTLPANAEPKAAAAAAPTVVTPPVAEKKAPEAPVKVSAPPPAAAPPAAKAAAVEPPPAKPAAAAPVAEKQPAAAPPPAEKTAATAPAPKAEQAPKSPVSAKAPAPSGGSMPGFGSFSSAFPAGGAVVTTTVPPKTSSE